ncbi:3-hydroxybutyryl-CoA dehydrogenase [Rhodotorula toruloides]|uniref:3-hydroxybutyryl-CoA dehydrogenase n=1 Tax=Rhodotorula toruloides TaxID=5286 RepID=A0A511KJ60_RHOTO|nr:3-hydroxybutyryl-CoA dehydrogenase [Rhodotorula toruloides]
MASLRVLARFSHRPLLVPHILPSHSPASQRSLSTDADGIDKVAVIGAGQMGIGISYVAAKTAGVDVLISDRSAQQITKGLQFVDTLLGKEVKKGKMNNEEANRVRSRIKAAGDNGLQGGEFAEVDLVVEAVSENLAVKQTIFSQLATHLPPHAILASNTSSISLSTLAASAVDQKTGQSRARQVVGFHFFNPVPVMKLVELIPALQTDPSVLDAARAFAERMGKTVTQSADTPGFISNRLLMPFINEAIIALETGVATKEDIDTTLKLGMNHPMGPLTLADFIGLDTCLSIMEVLMRETGDSKYRPSVLLGRMVSAGYLGKKSGQGFYTYTAQPPPPPRKDKNDGTDADPPYGNAEGDVDVGLGRLLLKSIGADKKQ